MKIELRNFRCMVCQELFQAEIVMDCPVDVLTASMKTIHCPKCGENWEKIAFQS